ncbi:MAG TPA: hypothetical protein VF582_05390 [Allosphingosinicella sp.]|jgi:hypothetical protein
MTDNRSTDDIAAMEHDEYHSSLEIDDSSGWRVFLVPGIALLFVLGAIAMVMLSQGDAQPDPRIAARLEAQQAKARAAPPPLGQPATSAPAANPPAAAPAAEPPAPAQPQ